MHGFARLLGLIFSVLLCAPAPAVEVDGLRPETLDELKAAVAKVLEENDVPSVGIAMVDETGPVWVGAIGKASLENGIDADEYSLYRIGSTSKMFVALSVLKLVEEGKLSLDDRLAELAPEIEFKNQWEETDPVRVVHLLEHTTGWDDIHLPEYASNDPSPLSLKEGLDLHPHSRSSRWKPGSRMSYCNAGPPVAAFIVQKITGQEFEGYVREHFFEPIGMTQATYRRTEEVEDKGVTSYANGNKPQDYWHIAVRPSGSINASPRDMARMVAFFLNRGAVDGRQLVSRQSLERMERVESTSAARAGQEIGYGLNNYSSAHESWIYRAHDGGVNGGITELAYLPEGRFGHAIMINSDDFASFRKISELVRNYETRKLEPKAFDQTSEIEAGHRDIAGLYYPINSRQQISFFLDRVFNVQRLSFEGNQLRRRPLLGRETDAYAALTPTQYRSVETGAISLVRTVDPLAGPVVHAGTTVLKPASPLLVYGQLGVALLWGLAIVTSFLYFLVWGIRKLRGRIPAGATIRIRVWPLLAGLSVVALVGFFVNGMADPFRRLGTPSPTAIGIMVSSLLFAVFAGLGVSTAIRERHAAMNRFNYWYSSVAAFLHGIVAIYLLWFGVIGLMTWA